MNITLFDYKEVYKRLISGKPYDKKLKPYSELQLNRVITILELDEEYEKCQIIKSYIDNNMNHSNGYLI